MGDTKYLQPPSVRRLWMEPFAIWELATFYASSPLARFVAEGDGHPVLFMPGLGGGDHSTAPLRRMLRRRGHDMRGWGLGTNIGAHGHVWRGLHRRVDQLVEENDGEPISLVGWSLGGVFAREFARERPAVIRQVITVVSPFRFRPGDRGNASGMYDIVGPRTEPFSGRESPEHDRPALTVPVTSIYTRNDGIVAWHSCLEVAGPRCENIEVLATHSGAGWNMLTAIAVADRLAQGDEWKPFRPPRPLRPFFPRPASWRQAAAS